ncbi:MAG: FtsX-like permease family protein, partial [Candidatus Lokiarchaeota archaeon]|nr:FtsX-like permease family protein [Candidatus Lokiarchaeota archaeon]
VKLNLYSQDMSQDIIFDVQKNDSEFDFEVINLEQRITQQQLLFSVINVFFSITLDATIIICLFGLLSSSYSTIIERKKEIGIIRTLGLKGKEIVRLFTIESLIIMMSSGTVGVIVGWVTGLLLSMSMNMMSGLPNIPIFPLTDMIIIFSLSIIFTLIGIRLLLRKSRKKNIVEIYRETT